MAIESTRLVRIAADLADKLGWISRINRGGPTAAERLDPLIRPAIDAEFARIADSVEEIKAVEARHAPAAELGNPVG